LVDYLPDLEFARGFSRRNGFGPVPKPPNALPLEDIHISRFRALHTLLSTITAAEEAAIRQITPLISIVSLTHGNIGSKGNTSCVWQKSKLNQILPNLPQECKFIIIRRNQRSGSNDISNIKSTKFSRERIHALLVLLSSTCEPWTSITIDNDRLYQWPAEGDLALLNPETQLNVDDEDSSAPDDESPDPPLFDTDGPDSGPAHLQNTEIPDETFEGVVNVADGNASRGSASLMAVQAVDTAVQRIREEAANPGQSNTSLPVNTSTFNQQDVLPVDGFANMNTTKYAWARAFPSCYIPSYIYFHGEMRWVILNDITGSFGVREKSVTVKKWLENEIWRSDGVPAGHPTWAIVLNNHKMKMSLQKQGSYVISTADVDPTTTLADVHNATTGDELDRAVSNMMKTARMHASNVPGTTPYWESTRFEMKAINFHNSYILERDISIFHTGSLAEYHEPWLRNLLSRYTAKLDSLPPGYSQEILDNDAVFNKAVQKYKHVVTHYLASKMEIWTGIYMVPIYDAVSGSLTFEFAKSRGAIHYHSILACEGVFQRQLQLFLKKMALAIHRAVEVVNTYIAESFKNEEYAEFKVRPDKVYTSKDGESVREKYCTMSRIGVEVWSDYCSAKYATINEANLSIGKLLETKFGVQAIHTGFFPDDWVKPGGYPFSFYPHTTTQMQSSSDVVLKKELKQPKFRRETHLAERRSNITNHACTHKCSSYCLRTKHLSMKYCPTSHAEVDESKRFCSAGGVEMVKLDLEECKMRFGEPFKFDTSGENNLTRGVESNIEPSLAFDPNGMPRFVARRNHPRIIQQPYAFFFYGANNDIQILMNNATGKETLAELGIEEYERFTCNLAVAKMGCLEHGKSHDVLEEYLTKYTCKGGDNSNSHEETIRTVTDKYCSGIDNASKSLRSLMGKQMNQVSSGMSITRDQCQYMLGGGNLKRNTCGSPLKCSVTSVSLDDFGDSDIQVKNFTWQNIVARYKSRSEEHYTLNIYRYCALHWKPGGCVPQFFGYHDVPSWPLVESYSKWTLILFKPWTNEMENVMSPFTTYADALGTFMFDPDFPAMKRSQILRAKRNEAPIDFTAGDAFGGDDNASTPTEQRRNLEFEDAIEAESSPPERDEDFEDMDETLFQSIESRIPDGYDWSENHNPLLASKLQEFVKIYYDKQTADTIAGSEQQLILFDNDVHKPENCKGSAQKFLIYEHIYYHYQIELYKTGQLENQPPSLFTLVEGKPGTGKTFVTKTLRNITRKITGRNSSDMASAPTGCAASLIEGTTHCRCCSIPVGGPFQKSPSNLKSSDPNKVRAMKIAMSGVVTRLMDEHSMAGRSYWAWLCHRTEELRRPAVIVDENHNPVYSENSDLPSEVYNRPWGGLPFLYSMGDSAQLPPVMQKSMYSKDIGRPTTSDHLGRIVIQDFLHPLDLEEVKSTIVVMDEVLRQDDIAYLSFLENIRNGCVTGDDVSFIIDKCRDMKETFKDAIHLVPRWKMAHPIVHEYIQNMTTPVAKIKAQYVSCHHGIVNHCAKESSLPTRVAICVGSIVMLLRNFVVEYKLMNGSVGTIREIVYKSNNGPDNDNELPSYVIVEFPNSTIPEEDSLIPGKPATMVPIPIVIDRCQKRCCSVTTVPLRVCIAITIHKSQGMTIGDGQIFEKVIVYLPEAGSRSDPGLELVAFSRASGPDCVAVGNNSSTLTEMSIKKIGKSVAYDLRREFEQELKQMAYGTQAPTIAAITMLDEIEYGDKTYEGGCRFLLNWFNEKTSSR
jgi:hypothetical protein